MTLNERFDEWSAVPPADLVGDPIWRLPAFRIGVFLSELLHKELGGLASSSQHSRTVDQLLRSVDSIAANIAEGYGHHSGRDRARYYELALGSAREARVWCRALVSVMGEERAQDRLLLLTRAVQILTKAIPEERERFIARNAPATEGQRNRDSEAAPAHSEKHEHAANEQSANSPR